MKRFLLIFTICLISLFMNVSNAEFEDRTADYYTELDNNGLMFLLKMQSCKPATNEATKEVIHGRTKGGSCYYSYNDTYKNRPVVYDCVIPMRVMVGYATTAYDVYDYSKGNPEISNERLSQNNEIRKIMQDYCKMKLK